jgi:hypothetical protein
MIILVADTSVMIDLERGQLLELALSGPDILATPDMLYERELADNMGPRLVDLGLQIINLDGGELSQVQMLAATSRLAIADCAAFVAARRPDHELLTGDQALRTHSEFHGIPCHGLLWLLDRIEGQAAAAIAALHAGLSAIASNRRCRLPPAEVAARLQRWRS